MELHRDVAVALDQFGTLLPAADGVTEASKQMGELSLVAGLQAEEFDQATINEADAAISTMHAAVDATEMANLSADGLRAALERM